jgi:acetylornithine/N-succinyldiaminopimelate aminotransferase
VHIEWANHEAVKSAITDKTAAIMVEPLQGEGGIRPLSDDLMRSLRTLCDAHGILLILDEVQCGVGRTGKLFAHEWSGVTPDIMMVAKGIGGGFPLGAVLATESAAFGMTSGTHGSTYGGNPLACAVGCSVVDHISDPAFLENVRRKSALLIQGLLGLVASYPEVFEEVRGYGLMLGLKCKPQNSAVLAACYAQELITVPAGDNVIRLLPPLNLSDEEIGQAVSRLDNAASACKETLKGAR